MGGPGVRADRRGLLHTVTDTKSFARLMEVTGPTQEPTAESSRDALTAELRQLRAVVSKQCAELITLKDMKEKYTNLQAELIDTRLERNEANKRAAEFKSDLDAASKSSEAKPRDQRDLDRIRQYFRYLPDDELRTQLAAREGESSSQLQEMDKEELLKRIMVCFHKPPRAMPSRTTAILAFLRKYAWIITPLVAIMLSFRPLMPAVEWWSDGGESRQWLCGTLSGTLERVCAADE